MTFVRWSKGEDLEGGRGRVRGSVSDGGRVME